MTAGRWGAGSSATTASSAATRASGTPTWSTTTTRSSRRGRAEEGYHLTEDLADKAIEFISDAKQVDPDKPFYLHFCPGATHAPHHVPEGVGRPLRGRVRRRLGRLPREGLRAPEGARDHPARTRSCRATTPTCPTWESLSDDQRRLYARMMEVFAGFLIHTDHHIGRLLDHLEAIGELDNTLIMVISDNGASAEGGPTGTTNEAQFFNNAPEPFEDSLAAIDEIGGPKHFNHYPWGWTWAGNTPFRRWKRETYRGGVSDPFIVSWPKGITAERRGARAVRARHRHGPDRARRARHRAAGDDPRRAAVAAARHQLRAHLRRPRGGERAHDAVLRDDGPPVDLPRRLAGGVPVAGPVVRRGRQGVRRADLRGDARASSTRRAGSSTTSPRTRPRTTTSPPSTATG